MLPIALSPRPASTVVSCSSLSSLHDHRGEFAGAAVEEADVVSEVAHREIRGNELLGK